MIRRGFFLGTLANDIILVRILLTFAAVGLLAANNAAARWTGLAVMITAALLDAADGYIARRSGTASPAGGMFDIAGDRIYENVLFYRAAAYPGRCGHDLYCAVVPCRFPADTSFCARRNRVRLRGFPCGTAPRRVHRIPRCLSIIKAHPFHRLRPGTDNAASLRRCRRAAGGIDEFPPSLFLCGSRILRSSFYAVAWRQQRGACSVLHS